jgi:hypothetical protein
MLDMLSALKRPRFVVLLFAVVAALLVVQRASAHPKPGAHADVRIQVESDRVRLDVLMNVLFADQVVNVLRAKRDDVSDDEAPAMEAALSEFFGAGRPSGIQTTLVDRATIITIDGIQTAPTITKLTTVRPDAETRPGFIQNPVLLIPRVHVIADYPCKSPPKSVSIAWGAFPRDFVTMERDIVDVAPPTDIEAVIIGRGDLSLVTFRKTEPEITWHAPIEGSSRFAAVPAPPNAGPGQHRSSATETAWARLLVPMVIVVGGLSALAGSALALPRARRRSVSTISGAAVFAGLAWIFAITISPGGLLSPRSAEPPVPPDEQALAIFAPLHANIYRAFDYTRETEIYDALAQSVDGPMLEAIYNDVYRGLIMQEEGGALARVKSVIPIATDIVGAAPPEAGGDRAPSNPDSPGFVVRARWRVLGVVYHWGHSHSRTNEYAAEYTIRARAGGYRIVAALPLEQRRIEPESQASSPASTTRRASETVEFPRESEGKREP